jgi:Clp amino terminal domain, pathogenicity island component
MRYTNLAFKCLAVLLTVQVLCMMLASGGHKLMKFIMQAISTAPQLAAAAGQQLVQPEHLAKALLEQVRATLQVLIDK